ncbi:MAG: SH3 domain-containing protein [Planctomycetaceae bacterium]|nr:MAG: SH3 domain-containing protein [Planctomycetaceae bacterium]
MYRAIENAFSSRWSSFVLIAVVGFSQALGQDAFDPFDVYVDQEEVMARSGPGGEYYRTDPLRHGQRLEVYLETESGWLGVRPPDGSFSWVPADAIQPDRSGQSGSVIEDGAPSWIGTQLGKARKYMWQVQLTRGETVVILGRAEREGPDGPQLWYRIAPPAGEFRWVHRKQVVEDPEALLRDKPKPGSRVAQAPLTPADPQMLGPVEREPVRPGLFDSARSVLQTSDENAALSRDRSAADALTEPGDGVRLFGLDVTGAIPLAAATPSDSRSVDSFSADVRSPAGVVDSAQPLRTASFTESTSVAGQPQTAATQVAEIDAFIPAGSGPIGSGVARTIQPPLVTIASEPTVRAINLAGPNDASGVQPASGSEWVAGATRQVARDTSSTTDYAGWSLDALQLELSRRMVAAAGTRELDALRTAVDRLAGSANSETDRQRAAQLSQRIRQYQSVAARRDGQPLPSSGSLLESTTGPVVMAGASVAQSPIPPGQVTLSPPSDFNKPEAEATGYLVQVYSARPNSPPFALTDASGRTTHYVSPFPGFNLRRYLNQHITLAGQAGHDTGLDTPHIIAGSVIRSPDLR